jgi:hypothetical protein
MNTAHCRYALEGEEKANSDWTTLALYFSRQSADVAWFDLFQARQNHLKEKVLSLDVLPSVLLKLVGEFASRRWTNIEPGDFLQVKDDANIWWAAFVLQVRGQECEAQDLFSFQIRYVGWSTQWIRWLSIADIPTRCRPVSSVPLIHHAHQGEGMARSLAFEMLQKLGLNITFDP